MKLAVWNNKFLKPILIIVLLVAMLGIITACTDLGFPSSTPAEKPEPEPVTHPTIISTKDAALLAVHQRLLGQAESYQAKIYLADFYAICDNWSAESEFFKDGSDTWYVLVDMTANQTWEWRTYWQQASWFVFKDGKVIPSNYLQANALRIEADLQALSPESERDSDEENES